MGRKIVDHGGFENKYFKIIGPVGISQGLSVVLNKFTNDYEVRQTQQVIHGYAKGFRPKTKNGVTFSKSKQRWEAYATLNNKRFFLGGFRNKENAISAVLDAETNYRNHKTYPKKIDFPQKNNKSGIKNIHFQESENKWRFAKTINGKKHTKRFNTLEEALIYKKKLETKKGESE